MIVSLRLIVTWMVRRYSFADYFVHMDHVLRVLERIVDLTSVWIQHD
jgi:hypothetical protein